MSIPKISVLVPCYNVEKYIKKCLSSIVNQTLKEIEIICINDGSTDTTQKILETYAQQDSRIIIIHKSNSGYGDSMNRGLEKATGEYIGIVESDDFIDLDMFEKLYDIAKKYDVQIVKGNFWNYLGEKEINRKAFIIPPKKENKVINPQKHQQILMPPSIWAAIYKKSFLQENDIKFSPTPGASYQDTSFNFKAWAMAKKAFLTKDAFYHYRRDNTNSSVHNVKKIFCICDEYHEIEKFIRDKKLYEEFKYLISALKFDGYYWNFNRLSFPLNYQFLKHFSKEFLRDYKKGLINKTFYTRRNYRYVRILIKHPLWFLIKYYFREVKIWLLH